MPSASRKTTGDGDSLHSPLDQLAQALCDADHALQQLLRSRLDSEGQHITIPRGSLHHRGSQHNLNSPATPTTLRLSLASDRSSLPDIPGNLNSNDDFLSRRRGSTHSSSADGVRDESTFEAMQSMKNTGFVLLECWQSKRGSQMGSIRISQISRLSGEEPQTGSKMNLEFDVHEPPPILKHVIIHPHSAKRFIWDISSLILVIYDMFIIPLSFFDIEESDYLRTMNWITRLFWSCDMFISLVSGFMTTNGYIEMRPKLIVCRYLRTWAALDACVVGIDWLELIMTSMTAGSFGFARLGKASRVFRILRLLRFLRLARMKEVWNLLCEKLGSQKLVIVLDIAKLLVVMCAAGHLVGSLFYAVGKIHDRSENWIEKYNFQNKSTEYRYIMSLRWAMSQFAGGMDEVTPSNFDESVYAALTFFSAYWCGAVFLSVLTSSMTEFCLQGTQQRQKLTALRNYLHTNGISNKLCVRVNRNAAHAVRMKEKTEPEGVADLFDLVSAPLQREIHFEMYEPSLSVHPFFRLYVHECPHVMRRVCHSAVSMSAESIGDVIFNVGEVADHPSMHIVSRGCLTYTSWSGNETQLIADDWVAEATLWVAWMYRGLLATSEDSLLCNVDARKFQQTVSQFEHADNFDPRDYATRFVRLLNEVSDDLSDLPPPAQIRSGSTFSSDVKRASSVASTDVVASKLRAFSMKTLKSINAEDAFSVKSSKTVSAEATGSVKSFKTINGETMTQAISRKSSKSVNAEALNRAFSRKSSKSITASAEPLSQMPSSAASGYTSVLRQKSSRPRIRSESSYAVGDYYHNESNHSNGSVSERNVSDRNITSRSSVELEQVKPGSSIERLSTMIEDTNKQKQVVWI